MHFDPDKDNSLADDLFTVLERAVEEQAHATAAILAATWSALHENRTHELAEAIAPFSEGLLLKPVSADPFAGGRR